MNNLLLNVFISPHAYIKYNSDGQYVDLNKSIANIKTGSKEEKLVDPVIH